jgi:hypothetical protein
MGRGTRELKFTTGRNIRKINEIRISLIGPLIDKARYANFPTNILFIRSGENGRRVVSACAIPVRTVCFVHWSFFTRWKSAAGLRRRRRVIRVRGTRKLRKVCHCLEMT